MSSLASRRAPLTVRTENGAVIVEVGDTLDERMGDVLVDAVASAVATTPERVDIDLTALSDWTPEGADSLVQCREMCRGLPDGLHYRTGRGPGRDALLAAYR